MFNKRSSLSTTCRMKLRYSGMRSSQLSIEKIVNDIEHMIVAATKATSLAITIYLSGMEIKPTDVMVENIVPNYNICYRIC